MTTAPNVAQKARQFINDLGARPMHRRELARLKKIYRKPRFIFAGAGSKRTASGSWLVPLVSTSWDSTEEAQAKKGRIDARKRMTHRRRNDLHEFQWSGGRFIKEALPGDELFQILRAGRTHWVYRKGVIVGCRRYEKRGHRHAIFYVEISSRKQRIRLASVRTVDRKLAMRLRKAVNATRAARTIERVMARFWPE